MKNLEQCVNDLTEIGRLEVDFDIQLMRAETCLEKLDTEGANRWIVESRKTLNKMTEIRNADR